MRLLVDTHVVIWAASGDPRLAPDVAAALADRRNEVLASAVVVWEVAIKRALGRLRAPDDIADVLLQAGATPLAVSLQHAAAVEHLPRHHGDPFDRLLVAQARLEGAVIVSGDAALRAYDVPVLWA